jgi:hypothetical protein
MRRRGASIHGAATEDAFAMEGARNAPERRPLLHCFSPSERVAHLKRKHAQAERLLQEGCTLFVNTALQHRIV